MDATSRCTLHYIFRIIPHKNGRNTVWNFLTYPVEYTKIIVYVN